MAAINTTQKHSLPILDKGLKNRAEFVLFFPFLLLLVRLPFSFPVCFYHHISHLSFLSNNLSLPGLLTSAIKCFLLSARYIAYNGLMYFGFTLVFFIFFLLIN